MPVYRNSITWMAMFGVMTLMFVKLPPMVARQDSVLNTYSALVEVDALAKQRFVEPITDDRLVDGAIRGMMRQLDPYSGYISPEELPGFQRRNRGQFCGVGLEVGVRDGRLTIIAPIEGSPAARAGILAGDVLIAVNRNEVEGLSTFEVEEMLVGQPGEGVTLTVRRPGEDEPQVRHLVREQVALRTVRGIRRSESGEWDYWIDRDAGIGYVRVSNFRENTVQEFDEALTILSRGTLNGLILDLRFNPGGFLHQAVAMADRFLSDGLIISTVTRRSSIDEYRAQPSPSDVRAKLVVLMNEGSASSSEIVGGALQARGRASVVGERSFGKGSVQHLLQLVGQKAAIKLTVAHYRLPDGRIIHRMENGRGTMESGDWGVKPDIEVALTPEERHRIQENRRLLDLPPTTDSDEPASGSTSHPVHKPEAIALEVGDRQLQAAVDLTRRNLSTRDARSDAQPSPLP